MNDTSYIKLFRKLRENPIYKNSTAVHVWIECLMRATYKPKTIFQGRNKVELLPGQFIMGREEFGSRIGCSSTTTWFWIKQFELDSQLDIKTSNKGTVVSIKNWNDYCGLDSKVDNKRTADGQQMDTTKKEKNKYISKDIYGETPPKVKKDSYGNEFVNLIMDWFTKKYQFQPTDYKPRRRAFNLVQKTKKLIKESSVDLQDMSMDERVRGVLNEYLAWVSSQDWADKIKSIDALVKNFEVFQARELGRKKYV